MSNQLLWCADIKERSLFEAEIVKTLGINILGESDGLAIVFSRLDRF